MAVGEPRKRITPELEQTICRAYESNKSMNYIYEKYGVCKPRQRKIYKKYNIPIKDRHGRLPNSDEQQKKDKIVVMAECGKPAINCNKQGRECCYYVTQHMHKCDYYSKTKKIRGCDPTCCTKWQPKQKGQGKKNVAKIDKQNTNMQIPETV